MQAIDILMDEHRVIERVLAALETAVQRLEQGQAVRPGFFLDGVEFITGFADEYHHREEEVVLFKAMVAAGMSSDGGPIAVMLSEHELARAYTRAMREAALKLQAGETAAQGALVHAARAYAALLREHIAKEDGVLYPLSSRVIPAGVQTHLAAEIDRVEHAEAGARDKYLALAGRLSQEMGLA
jgi:hemerythrin-like domain-containing protein